MKVRTKIFKLAAEQGLTIPQLAEKMGLHYSMLYRVRNDERGINESFIRGARRAFPDKSLDELFVVEPDNEQASVA